jgi:hypothetical protein
MCRDGKRRAGKTEDSGHRDPVVVRHFRGTALEIRSSIGRQLYRLPWRPQAKSVDPHEAWTAIQTRIFRQAP